MPVKTICWEKNHLTIIDQTLLPTELKYLHLDTVEELWSAIKQLKVRGAPALGIAAAFGIYLGIRDYKGNNRADFDKAVISIADYIGTSRPTAINLFWAIERIIRLIKSNKDKSVSDTKKLIFDEAQKMIEEDNAVCKNIGKNGATLLKNGDTILTHCNTGGLATASYGTALGIVFYAKEIGKKISVIIDETRPLLQGARLTAWECMQEGIDCTLICDNMAATVMKKRIINAVIVGADRIAANGDVANKIGTYNLAILAKEHKIPFYIAAPTSTIDLFVPNGDKIPIEERNPDEVRKFGGIPTAPEKVKVFNPAFDVTPHKYITAIITEKGIVKLPFSTGLKKVKSL